MKESITINGEEYKLGYNLRVRMIYERIIGKPIGVEMLTFENIVYFFSVLLAFNKDTFKFDLETFSDYVNDHEDCYKEFLDWVIEYWNRQNDFQVQEEDNKSSVKKKL